MVDPVKASNGITYDRFSAFEAIDGNASMPGCPSGTFAIVGAHRVLPHLCCLISLVMHTAHLSIDHLCLLFQKSATSIWQPVTLMPESI